QQHRPGDRRRGLHDRHGAHVHRPHPLEPRLRPALAARRRPRRGAPVRRGLRALVDPVHLAGARRDHQPRRHPGRHRPRRRPHDRLLPRPRPAVRALRRRHAPARQGPGLHEAARQGHRRHRRRHARRSGPHARHRGLDRIHHLAARDVRGGIDLPVKRSSATAPRASFGKAARSFARRWWHQLTSMRTALLLLLALALAAIPGSVFPQRSINPTDVNGYYTEHPDLAPVLDRLWVFDVYTSPWFSAIYLLLMISLIGCIVPRLGVHLKALRTRPPEAPKRMEILPYHRRLTGGANETRARAALKQHRLRTVRHEAQDSTVTLAAEKGYLRESGNLLFHASIVFILVGVAAGSLFSWYGNRILSEGEDQAFCNNLQQYDEYG